MGRSRDWREWFGYFITVTTMYQDVSFSAINTPKSFILSNRDNAVRYLATDVVIGVIVVVILVGAFVLPSHSFPISLLTIVARWQSILQTQYIL
mmetsp:Transcript_18281/g.41571  ORF Transcript_18281/g.41571 Transcript_18281/m.41571 type:complete len:94 (+) Transcript_18281:419-700(+)